VYSLYTVVVLALCRNPEILNECEIDDVTREKLLENIRRRLTPQAVKIRSGQLRARRVSAYQYFTSLIAENLHRVTTCLESLEMSGNLKHVREMSGKICCHGKVSQNCSLLDDYLRSYGYFVVSS